MFSKRMMVGVTIGLLSTTACMLDTNKDPDVKPDGTTPWVSPFVEYGVNDYELWRFCRAHKPKEQPYSLEQNANYASSKNTIFIGKAVQRSLQLNRKNNVYTNACYVRFKVDKVIKGTIDNYIWVQAIYNDQVPFKEKLSYKHCYIQTGKRYILSGEHDLSNIVVNGNKLINPVVVAKDSYSHSNYVCPPVESLPEGNALVTEIKKILAKEKR